MNENGSFVEELMGIKGGARGIAYDAKRDRFNMPHCFDTSVNEALNANRIIIDGQNIAIATQYPFPYQVEAQLQMLLDNCTPVLIVLASSTDIQNHQLPEYFSGSATYGQIQTQSKFIDYIELGNDVEAKVFKLSVTGQQVSIEIPVLHVYNWPDHRTVCPETTTKLVELIESTAAENQSSLEKNNCQEGGGIEKMLPVIHCKAGVGRTGQTLAALAMNRYPELSLDSITKDLRASRNNLMIQTPYQMKTLLKLANMQSMEEESVPKTKTWRSSFTKIFGS